MGVPRPILLGGGGEKGQQRIMIHSEAGTVEPL